MEQKAEIQVSVHKEDEQGRVFTLLKSFRVRWQGRRLYVPKGFKSDGASVPRIFWRLVFPSCDTTALRAALAHDYLYDSHLPGWSKEDADNLFYDVLVRDGVSKWRAWMAYKGVDMFGGLYWRKKIK